MARLFSRPGSVCSAFRVGTLLLPLIGQGRAQGPDDLAKKAAELHRLSQYAQQAQTLQADLKVLNGLRDRASTANFQKALEEEIDAKTAALDDLRKKLNLPDPVDVRPAAPVATQASAPAPTAPPEQSPLPPILGPISVTDVSVQGRATPGADVNVKIGDQALDTAKADANGRFEASRTLSANKQVVPLRSDQPITATQKVHNLESDPSAPASVAVPERNGEQMRAIIGFEQAGASASANQQKFFADFYVSRPLPFWVTDRDNPDLAEARLRWWGNVRIGSVPQPGTDAVAAFSLNFASKVGNLQVNQLAESAEFLGGLEWRCPFRSEWCKVPFLGESEESRQRFALGFFLAFGATGTPQPATNVLVFSVPSSTSPDFARFQKTYPKANNSQFVAFVNPDRERFAAQYYAGLRLTTRYIDKDTREILPTAPAMVSVGFGQNEVVTGGRLQGIIGRAEAFYPLPFNDRRLTPGTGVAGQMMKGMFSGIYLFGTVNFRLQPGAGNRDPFILAPATGILPSDPRVATISSPSTRDTYRIGVGIDALSVFNAWKANAAKTPPTDATGSKQ